MSESENPQSRPSVSQQSSFGEDGSLETSDEPVETQLDDWGMEINHQQRETRIEEPKASLTADTRPTQGSINDGEQGELFHETADGQVDLTGEETDKFHCQFETDDVESQAE
jgi:hypothetical protein